MMTLQLGLFQPVEVVRTQFVIGLLRLEHMVDDDQQGVGDSDQRFVDAAATGEPAELRADVGGLTASIGPRHLAQDRLEPGIATSCLAAQAFAPTLLVTWTD